ncbi:MAG: murein biosynthesis integral membrane protein MurJ [Roseiflexus sp.]|nr:murein biosynthesis integral membrane protein MurJ [Roseiflexus sp.]MCS7288575.1 murein biosynthesis integral membrane protein MurJ [Roseiflexus sp.]MDW8145287.1 murein biosynthesis integral membrane protein MurJ [Roseiflexaceae bacterium]MDW8232044.1 murein biosynthesis integral membrane protein MurJ [Roseiflexaceae bacterium]
MSGASGAVVRRVATAALLIAVGNIASRLIGVVREAVIAGLFGRGADVAAFTAASAVPTIVYDLLVNGAISAALVPVFSAYAEEDEAAFWRVAATIINLALGSIALTIGLLIWQTPAVVTLLAGGFDPELQEQTVVMTRLLLPSVFFMGLSGLITALLYARQRFLLPAFTTSIFNLGIILGAVLLHSWLGPLSLVAGVLLGSVLQVALQLPGLRDATHVPFLTLDLMHPGVHRILALYAPVALGIGFSVVGIVVDRNLASRLTPDAIPTMRYATALVQFPLGLVAAAVSFAVLPTLARQASAGDEAAFRVTLAMGIKIVLLLILPATAGLAALATPIVALLYERGAFGGADTQATARALLFYLPGLPAAALDQMILFAFYARQRTLTPNLVQGAAILIYVATALPLLFWTPLGVAALILANSAQWIGHALILYLLSRRLVDLSGLRIGETLWKCLVACAALFCLAWWLGSALAFAGPLVALLGAGGLAALTYAGLCLALRVEALDFLVTTLRQRGLFPAV